VRSIGEMYFPNNLTTISIQDVNVIGRAALPGRNIEQLSVQLNRQPIDARTDRSIPENSGVVNVQAIDHSRAESIYIGDVKPPSDGTRGHSSDITDARNRVNGLDQSVIRADVVDRDGSPKVADWPTAYRNAPFPSDGRLAASAKLANKPDKTKRRDTNFGFILIGPPRLNRTLLSAC